MKDITFKNFTTVSSADAIVYGKNIFNHNLTNKKQKEKIFLLIKYISKDSHNTQKAIKIYIKEILVMN